MIGRKNAKHYFSINDAAYFALTRIKLEQLEKGKEVKTSDLLSKLVLKGAESFKNEN